MARKYFSRFTPSLMSPEDLEGIFVQRQKLAARLVDLIRESTLTAAKHYNLLIGPRGIGKTHLVSLVYHRLKKQEDLQDRLRIAWLSEEEYGVGTLLDLFLRILKALIKEYSDSKLEVALEQLYALSQEEAEAHAGSILKQWIAGKTLLIIVENLDDLFSGLRDIGQKQLRSYLQENPFCTILATSPTIFNGISLQTSPFYGFFRNQQLDSLTPEEVKELLKKLAQQENNQELAKYLDTARATARIKAIHHLAGGCHRVYIIFYQFLNLESLENLTDLFVETLDELTPYYQSRMAYLSNQQRKIVEFLCETRNAVPVKEIARRCFLSHQATSSQLKEILEKGYVLTVPCGKESWYEIREPLMRFCLDIKHSRGTSAQLIIDFLKLWYSRGKLESLYLKDQQYRQGLEHISQFIEISSSLPFLEFSKSDSLEFTLQEMMTTCLRLLSAMKATDIDLQTWLDRWKLFSPKSKQLEIPMRLLETWIRYRETKGDLRVLLSLPVEERRILEELTAGKTEEEDQ
jgi:tetratricopeptide (TPR) repeat protein